ncbi:hypothetical protein GM921_00750 [Pedobacter sp. LMG 31464]|uniref:Fimbrial assembly protein (PilN) n=1 Tax=Pedobacter planticolens TaxID=2679964 RepID=A0A923IUB8_9SPHI|nr:PilN domain-containing protein [Pedobacter planticolens]MBB2143999.1 hypothetical protein [Pedobacter planticolens]
MVFGTGLKECLGVELKVLVDDSYSCRYLQVSLIKNNLELGKEFSLEGGIKTILEALPKTIPIALVMTGAGILLKKSTIDNGDEHEQLLFKRAFPSLERDEFYNQILVQGDICHLSISRTLWIDELLLRFERAELNVLQVSIGPLVATQVFGQLNRYGNEILFDRHHFTINEQKDLISYQVNSGSEDIHELKIEGHIISAKSILAYAAAFQFLLHEKIRSITANVASVHNALDKYSAHQHIRRYGLLTLFSSFGLLLVSFILFFYYNQQNAVLLQQVGAKANSLSDVEMLTATIARSEQQLKQLRWNGGYAPANLIDEMVIDLPKQLQLKTIEIKALQQENSLTNQIRVTGSTNDLQAMNNWMFLLKQHAWVKEVKLINYELPADEKDHQFNLSISY